ncbi:RHS repeat-associated core domain-containing protein [Microbulbifer sp. 2304DJ12-6]|uniref:RHS repeat-associated core domain-containing protein n=1 Tax=Microbulbifer sp. 2304DJ12-6 TaxID=3233340 RepID=UPI0039B019B7
MFGSLVHGSLAPKASADPDPYFCLIRFQGQWADEETGLYYNRFRYYDPQATQYMSPDPIEVQEGGVMGMWTIQPLY